jgi:hypothetical protein
MKYNLFNKKINFSSKEKDFLDNLFLMFKLMGYNVIDSATFVELIDNEFHLSRMFIITNEINDNKITLRFDVNKTFFHILQNKEYSKYSWESFYLKLEDLISQIK